MMATEKTMTDKELAECTYAQAESAYWRGMISQDQWEEYCRIWRNSTFRWSSLAESYQEGPSGER